MIKPEKASEVNTFLRKNLVRVRIIFEAGAEIVRVRTISPLGLCWLRFGTLRPQAPRGEYLFKCYLYLFAWTLGANRSHVIRYKKAVTRL